MLLHLGPFITFRPSTYGFKRFSFVQKHHFRIMFSFLFRASNYQIVDNKNQN